VTLKVGNKFTFTNDQSVIGDETIVSTTYADLPQSVKPGDVILVDDGLIGMTVEEVNSASLFVC
jgi:pyruvate kinase